jgi:CubicO group peptidase (beta-lactamase class C family)
MNVHSLETASDQVIALVELPLPIFRQKEKSTFSLPTETAMKRIAAFWILLLSVLLSTSAAQQEKQATVPASEAGRHVSAYLEAFNSSDEGAMREFFLSHTAKSALQQVPLEQRMSFFQQMKKQLGSLQLKQVIQTTPELVSTILQAKGGNTLQFDFEFEPQAPHGLIGIRVENIGGGRGEQVLRAPKANDVELVEASEAFVDSLVKADEFSGVLLLSKDGKPFLEKAYGYVDRDRKIPTRTDTKFNIGSINKTFTTIAIHQLASAGKLSLDDTIGKYLPEYPNKEAARKVTIQQLLDMTSGLGDFFGDRYEATPKEKIKTIRDYLPLFADKPLEFEPGTSRRYSNGGFIVLGAIIERVSGTDYYAYVRDHIFKPAGMTETESYEKDKEVPNRALGYTKGSGGAWQSNYGTLPGRGSSAGGGYSTVEDLLKYTIALKNGILYHPRAGGGLGIAGGAPGLNAALDWDPRNGYAIIVLSNFDPPAAERVARQIRAWLPNWGTFRRFEGLSSRPSVGPPAHTFQMKSRCLQELPNLLLLIAALR